MLIPQLLRRIRTLPQTCPTARRVLKRAPPCVACRRSGSALPPSDHTRRSLIQIDAESHPDCRAAPLSRLRMAIERLKGNPSDDAAQSEVARNIGELDTLVEEILLASRLQAAELIKEPIDLAGLLAEECAAYGAEVTVADHGGTPMIEGDPRLLKRLFRNLLQNATVHGGPEAPEVTILSGKNDIRVSVCDRGPGVPEGDLDKVFEPFYQGRTSAGGAGLGLTLVRQIAERHGGSVRCLPRDGGGACFEVLLPHFTVRNDALPSQQKHADVPPAKMKVGPNCGS